MDWSSVFFQGWADIARVAVTGTVAYVSLVLFLRISGKRTLAKLNAFDLVVTVALGSILAAIPLQAGVSVSEGLAAFIVLIGLQYVVTFISVRSQGFAQAVRSEPALLLKDGVFCDQAMLRERVTREEALSAIRSSGGREASDAESVVLESDGSISVSLRG